MALGFFVKIGDESPGCRETELLIRWIISLQSDPGGLSAGNKCLVPALERLLEVGEDLLLSGPLGIQRQVDGARCLPLPHRVLVLLGRDQPVVAQHREQGSVAVRHRMKEQPMSSIACSSARKRKRSVSS